MASALGRRSPYTVGFVRKAIVLLLLLALSACGSQPPRPGEETLRAQIDVLLNRAGNSQVSWNASVVKQQLETSLPQGKATSVGWMLEWKPVDGGLAYAIVPWSMLKVTAPKMHESLAYDGGSSVSKSDALQIEEVVTAGLDPAIRYLVNVHSMRQYGKYVAFSVTPLLPVADDGYGFVERVNQRWEVRDLGSAEVGCGLVPKKILNEFKVECSS